MMMRSSTSTNDQLNAEEELAAGTSSSSFVKKKLDHNAKERIRRMKLNASYLALRALLPDSRRSKKRWSAPSIVDKVLKYIPEVENEIQELESKKQNINVQLAIAAAAKNKNKKKINDDNDQNIDQYPTISVNEINKGQVIVQICMSRDNYHMQGGGILLAFTSLLQRVEDDPQALFCIKSVSSVYVCETRTCYHLHIQVYIYI
ncbi:hypothetical protein RD792_005827 [Penstemon davidsonii]|uniref:BHLH domain-containing protein n=1 Tax=Penstemon davidsonii TaxID=160366 RepID=A0ABR0DFB5_9LAMI|nr:hypothetical protein RD792_005827 [Penstemon davidsonii]